MAKIQGVQRTVSQPGSLGQARASTSLYEPIAQGAQQLGSQIDKVGFEMDKKKALADIEVAKTAMRERSLERSLYDRENRQGQAALDSDEAPGVYKQYDQDSTKWMEELSSSVSPRFQALARRELGGIQEGYKRQQAQYQAQQLGIYREAAVKNSLVSTKAQTVAVMEEPGSGISDIDTAAGEVRVAITANSGGRDVTENVRAAQATLFTDSIYAKMDTDPAGALEILEAGHAGYLGDNPQAVAKLREVIDEKRIEVGVETATSTITGSFDLENEYGDAVEAANEIADDDIRKGVMSELDYNKGRIEAIRRDEQTEALESYHDKIFVKQEPPSDFDIDNDPSLNPSAKQTAKAWTKVIRSGDSIVTNRQVYYDMNNMIADEPQKFISLDLTSEKVSGNLDASDWEYFAKLQRDLKSGKKTGAAKGISTAMTRSKAYFSEAGIPTGAKAKPKHHAKRIAIQGELAKWSVDFFEKNGSSPDEVEIDKKLNELFRTVTITDEDAYFFKDTERRFAFITVDDIPDSDREKLAKGLEKRGITVTDDTMVDYYKRYLTSQGQ